MKMKFLLCGVLLATCSIARAQSTELQAEALKGGPDIINRLHQREWVRLHEDGKVYGRVVVIENKGNLSGRVDNNVILSRDGKIVQQTKSGTDGWFELEGVEPGTYALQAVGEYSFATFALHVLPADASHLASSLDVYTTTIGNKVRDLLISSMVPTELQVGKDQYYRSHSHDPIAVSRQFNRDHQVKLQDGNLIGRVSRPGWSFNEQDLSGTIAHVLKGGDVVQKAQVDKDGYYKIEGLSPGIYDMLVAGVDGYAAFKFEAVSEFSAEETHVTSKSNDVHLVSTGSDLTKFVSMVQSDCLNCELVSQADVLPTATVAEGAVAGECDTCGVVESVGGGSAPCCGGGYAGGGGGGGGGGFFGGGGMLGLASTAGGVVALATRGGGRTPPPPTIIAP